MSEKVSVYYLEVHDPSEGKHQVRVHGETTVGSARNNSINVEEVELAPKHCVFRVHQEVLTVFQVAESGTSKIGRQSLDSGRMYILEKGDKLTLGELKIVVRLEKEIIEEALPEDDDEDVTDPNIEAPNIADEFEDEEDDLDEKPSFFAKLKARFKRAPKEEQDEEVAAEEFEEEEEEEEENTDEIKNSIYIPKAKVDEEDEEEKPKKKKKAKKVINRDDMPAFFARLYAFVAEVLIAFAFVANVVPILDLQSIYDQLNSDLTPYIQMGIDKIAPLIPEQANYLSFLTSFSFLSVLMTWIAINLVSNLIFGTNLGLALLGVQTEGSFVTARLKGLVRLILSFITLPTLITELPALIKKRTLKEVITASEISYRHSILKVFGVLILLPAFTLAVIALPGIMEPTLLEGPEVVKDLAVKENEAQDALQTHPWRKLNIAISYPQNYKSEWAISPILDEKSGKVMASVRFLRMRGESTDIVTLGPISHFQIPREKILAIAKLDPFFASKYPVLAQQLTEESLQASADKELIALFIDALAINWNELARFMSERGPILTPYLELKKHLIENFGITSSIEASLIGRRTFIQFFVTNNKSRYLSVINSQVVQVELSGRGNANAALAKFTRTFLSNAAPLMDNAVPTPSDVNNWTFLDWLDHFNGDHQVPLGNGSAGLSSLINEVLAARGAMPWAQETIETDYRRTMQTLQALGDPGNPNWANEAFNAMNAAPDVWQREDAPAQAVQEEQPQQ